ncbi:hypothetical protein Goari_022785, partial [Gossypium aridum]|nr:hypothetical protein [Gossypium aridum]
VDLVPTVEEYTTLLRCPKVQVYKAYSRATNVPTFLKKLMDIMGMSEQWVAARIKKKGDSKCIPWKYLRDLILTDPDVKKRVDVFALSVYSLVVFPKALEHVDEVVSDLFDRLDKGSLLKSGKGLLSGLLRKLLPIKRTSGYSKTRQHHMVPDEILYQCGDFDWVPLLGIWGASKRVNDNIPESREECVRSIEEHLQVVPSELEIIKQDFEKRSLELGRKIEQLEEEKMRLRLDVDIHKLEAKKLRKGKNKAEEDLNSLKTNYKKLRLSIRTAGLGKTAEQWQQKIKEEKTRANQRERNFRTPEPER